MKKNMGIADRVIRILIAVILVSLYFSGTISGVLGVLGLAVAIIFALTSMVSFCPLYVLFGINTCSTTKGVNNN